MKNFTHITHNPFHIKRINIKYFANYYFSKKWTIWILDEFVVNQDSFDLLTRIPFDNWEEYIPFIPSHTKVLLVGHVNHIIPIYRYLNKYGVNVRAFVI